MIDCRVRGLRAAWGADVVLDDIDLDISCSGVMVPVMGPSGRGKTTLLYHMAALKRPRRGRITWSFGADEQYHWGQGGLASNLATRLRRHHFAFVFQDSTLSEHLKVGENLSYPLILQGLSPRDAAERARATLARVFPDANGARIDGILRSYPAQVSGGQRQRVAVVQALLSDPAVPQVLFADEPTGNLDLANRLRLIGMLRDWATEPGSDRLVLWVTHHDGRDDPELADIPHRILVDTAGCRWQRRDEASGWHDRPLAVEAQ